MQVRMTRKSDIRLSYDYDKIARIKIEFTGTKDEDELPKKLCYILEIVDRATNAVHVYEYSDWDCFIQESNDN